MRLIDADALKQQFEIWDEDDEVAVWSIMNEVNSAPTIEPDRKKGKWNTDKESPEYATCSVCGHCDWDCTESEYFNFCPNCGADMRTSKC